MIDRQLIGDVVLAALIAVPAVAIAQPEPVPRSALNATPSAAQNARPALASTADRQVGLYR
jgi:hypothetical protein